MTDLLHATHKPSEANLMRISPIEDRIDEAIEKLNTLKRKSRRIHDPEALLDAQQYLAHIDQAVDRIEDAIRIEIRKGTEHVN